MALFKRKKVWWINLNYCSKRVRRSTYTTNKQLAENIHAKVLTQLIENKWFDTNEREAKTFLELAERYEDRELKNLKSWQKNYCYFKQLKEFFGSYPLHKITPALIDDFKHFRKSQGVKPATINRQLNILKRMLNLAHKRWMWLDKVPGIEMELKADNKRVRYLSFDDYHKLFVCCDEWLKGIVAIAAWSGLRQGNVLNLKRSQIDLTAKKITICGAETKNGETLIIPISTPALKVLEKALRVVHLNSSYVFCDAKGEAHKSRKAQRAFQRACIKSGIEDFRFHDLRHCFASWNRQAGVDLDTLADLLGHRDTRMTRRYAHISQEHLQEAIDLLDQSYSKRAADICHTA